jgi:predicted nucleic acid-binding protein
MALLFLDTNIFLRHLRQDHPDHSPHATAFLKRIEEGSVKARTSDTVIFESLYFREVISPGKSFNSGYRVTAY